MRKLVLSLAFVPFAAGLFAAPGLAAPVAQQAAIVAGARHALPTAEVRYRRHYAPRVYRPRVVYRTVYRTRYVHARPRLRRHRRWVAGIYAPRVYAPPAAIYYDAPQVYVPPTVYPQTYYDAPVYYGGDGYVAPRVFAPRVVAPVVPRPGWGGGGWAGRPGGGWVGGGGHRHR